MNDEQPDHNTADGIEELHTQHQQTADPDEPQRAALSLNDSDDWDANIGDLANDVEEDTERFSDDTFDDVDELYYPQITAKIKNFCVCEYPHHTKQFNGVNGYEWDVERGFGPIHYHTSSGSSYEGGCGLWRGDCQIEGTAQFVLSPDSKVALRQVKRYFGAK